MKSAHHGPVHTDWEEVAQGPTTKRLRVPGGWIYHVREYLSEPCNVFVPHAHDVPVVSVVPMAKSDGQTDWFVRIKVGERDVTPYKLAHEWQAQYEAEHFRWIFFGGKEPDLMAYSEAGWPGKAG